MDERRGRPSRPANQRPGRFPNRTTDATRARRLPSIRPTPGPWFDLCVAPASDRRFPECKRIGGTPAVPSRNEWLSWVVSQNQVRGNRTRSLGTLTRGCPNGNPRITESGDFLATCHIKNRKSAGSKSGRFFACPGLAQCSSSFLVLGVVILAVCPKVALDTKFAA